MARLRRTSSAGTAMLAILFAPLLPAQAAPPTARIDGVVVDLAGNGIVPARVQLVRTTDDTILATTATDGSGAFLLPRVPAERCEVRASADGHVRMRALPTWNAAHSAACCRLQLPDARTLRGRVVDDTGKPLRAAIRAYDSTLETDQDEPEATSDANGDYVLTGVPLGPLRIVVHAEGHALQLLSLPLGGDAAQDVVMQRQEGVTLVVQLTGVPKESLPQAICYFFAYDNGYMALLPDNVRRGHLDAEGRWVVRGLPASLEYRSFGAWVPGMRPVSIEDRAKAPFADNRIERTLAMQPAAEFRLHGVLRDDHDKPMASVPLVIETGDRDARCTTTADGSWSVTVSETLGDFWPLRIDDDRFVVGPRLEDANSPHYRNRHRLLRSDVPATLVALPAASLTGTVTTPGGAPAAGAMVDLLLADPGDYSGVLASVMVGSDGSFTFAREHPDVVGNLRLVARRHDDESTVELSTTAAQGAGGILRLPPLVLRPAPRWSGTLRDAGGQPLGGAVVRLEQQRARGDWSVAYTQVCARAGRFRFAAPSNGQWRVLAGLADGDVESEPLTADGSAHTFDLRAGN